MVDVIYAPWRYSYIKSTVERNEVEACVFCEAPRKSDDEALILVRGNHAYAIMNLFPYNTGHVMIVPYRHISDYNELTASEITEMHVMAKSVIEAVRQVLRPHGFNIGFNIGRVAGAGIDKHIHLHIVPRWSGDTNFMPVIAGTKIISQDVRETYRLLKPHVLEFWEKYQEQEPNNR